MFSFVHGAQVQHWNTGTRAPLTLLSEPLAGQPRRCGCCCGCCCCHSSSRRSQYSYRRGGRSGSSGGPRWLRLCLTLLLIVSAACQGIGPHRGSAEDGSNSSAPAIDLGAGVITKKTSAAGTRGSQTVLLPSSTGPVASAATTTHGGGVLPVSSRRSPESAKPRTGTLGSSGGGSMTAVTALTTVFGANTLSTFAAKAPVSLPSGRRAPATTRSTGSAAPGTPTTLRQQQRQQQRLSTAAASLTGVSAVAATATASPLAPESWTLYGSSAASSPTRESASLRHVNGSIQAEAVHWAEPPLVLVRDEGEANRTVPGNGAAPWSAGLEADVDDDGVRNVGAAATGSSSSAPAPAAAAAPDVTVSAAAATVLADSADAKPSGPSESFGESTPVTSADGTINPRAVLSPLRTDDHSSSLDFSELCPGFRRSVLIPKNCSDIGLCEEIVNQTIQIIRQKHAEGGFVRIMQQYDCREEFRYSEAVSCDKCLISYQQWLCSSHLTVYLNGSLADVLEPCADVCDAVVKDCPYVQPQQGSVEPCFRCRDRHIENDQIQLRPCYSFLTNSAAGADNVSSTYPEMVVRPPLANGGIGIFIGRSMPLSTPAAAAMWCCWCWLCSFTVSQWLTLSHWHISCGHNLHRMII